jgi:hypothetical protein
MTRRHDGSAAVMGVSQDETMRAAIWGMGSDGQATARRRPRSTGVFQSDAVATAAPGCVPNKCLELLKAHEGLAKSALGV